MVVISNIYDIFFSLRNIDRYLRRGNQLRTVRRLSTSGQRFCVTLDGGVRANSDH